MSDTSNFRNNLLIKFEEVGIVEFKNYCVDLVKDMEKRSGQEYNVLRGELAEVLLEALLRNLCSMFDGSGVRYHLIKNLAMIKRGSNGKLYSSEIDVCLCTEFRCYLFEVKSYKGHKTLTDECLLHGYSDMNIYEQSKMHLDFFRETFDDSRLKFVEGRTGVPKPYKLIFFEFSAQGVEDLRNDEWKERIRLLDYQNFYNFFIEELGNSVKQWDLDKIKINMDKLNSNRDMIMDYHLKRLNKR